MTGRLAEVQARIGSVDQISAVIAAMRGIAASRSREAIAQLDGIRAYAAMIGGAIGSALALVSDSDRPAGAAADGDAVIVLCAEQGFAGAFNERVLDVVAGLPAAAPRALLVVGSRGLAMAQERGMPVAWSAPMAARAGQVASLANRIAAALFQLLDGGAVARVAMVHSTPAAADIPGVAMKQLVPFDFRRFPPSRNLVAPLLTMPPRRLLAGLVEEYVFAEICEALMLSFAAENAARMRAMIAARSNVAKTLDSLRAQSRQLRQEEITNEIIELASGALATR
ncbi:MAG: F0F1 ATP synthase subunit gamma [Acetobacteraceae bacterium]|nr:F0F1 ATP synthase subunit gamma [Acetobacteraceae bacterium]